MPELGNQEAAIMKLYNRCRASNALPFKGGAWEQPAWVMDLLDTVDAEVQAARSKAEEEAQMNEEKSRRLEGLRNGH